MFAEAVHQSYVPLGKWSDSSTDFVSLLHAAEDEAFYDGRKFKGNRNYLARQAFLRSYQFCFEESFKDKLKKSIQRLNEESLEEILKESIVKLMRAAKAFARRHYENLHVKKTKQKMFSGLLRVFGLLSAWTNLLLECIFWGIPEGNIWVSEGMKICTSRKIEGL